MSKVDATTDDGPPNEHGARRYHGYCSQETLNNLSDDVGSLWAHSALRDIPILDRPPSPLTFLRDYVSVSRPCIIRNCIPSPSVSLAAGDEDYDNKHLDDNPLILSLDELVDICEESAGQDDGIVLTCDVTPDGHGDCIRTVRNAATITGGSSRTGEEEQQTTRRFFVKPEEKTMSIQQFRSELRQGRDEWYRNRRSRRNAGAITRMQRDEDGLAVFPLSDCTSVSHENHNGNDTDDDGECANDHPVVYYSRQNDCLRTELKALFDLNLFPQTFSFAEEAFATGPPDAVNLWIGDERAVSSMHKDHYENLFYVLSGEKVFTLCPPADVSFLHEGEFESGTFRLDRKDEASGGNGGWVVDPDYEEEHAKEEQGSTYTGNAAATRVGDDVTTSSSRIGRRVRWIEPDIEQLPGAADRYPRLNMAHPIRVRVSQGEMLYLPALWYHRVTQSCETVGLNYWYDMRFNSPSWCYFNFLQHIQIQDT
mmetsp:Transcript_1494/g.3195  ORF Transcript_1494/g.3195 Transcript_1494/m.3195 type:complete len:481 (+) Transcript_1494:89-1531(+)